MNEEQRIKLLEEELKILKNEVKTILLDIREQYLNIQNPFNFNMVANTPPAGANPESKAIEPEVPDENTEMPQDDFQMPPSMETEEISFGKPFTDLSANDDLPGMGDPEDMPGIGLAGGSEPSAEAGFAKGDESEEEQVQKSRNSRSRKKAEEEMEFDEDYDSEDDDEYEEEQEEREEKFSVKMGSPKNGKKKGANSSVFTTGNKADLVVIAGLTQWVDQSTVKLGKDRTEALVEMSTAMGRIPEKMKDVLIRMIRISRYEAVSQNPTATDYLAILAQLESLISGSRVKDSALLSVLSMMKESVRG